MDIVPALAVIGKIKSEGDHEFGAYFRCHCLLQTLQRSPYNRNLLKRKSQATIGSSRKLFTKQKLKNKRLRLIWIDAYKKIVFNLGRCGLKVKLIFSNHFSL